MTTPGAASEPAPAPPPPLAPAATTNSLGMVFVPVPSITARFSIWETRVQDFAAFVAATGYAPEPGLYLATTNDWELRADRNWRDPGFAQTPKHPVIGVNWHDARAFCRWLTDHERALGRLPPPHEYRLPTDREWSAAAGLPAETGETPQARFLGIPDQFPWGTNWPPAALAGNFAPELQVDPFERTAPVASFAPNRFGLFDLAGNVAEWCLDAWNHDKPFRVLRSAPWNNDCRSCLMSSYRFVNLPDTRTDYYGFRVVLAK